MKADDKGILLHTYYGKKTEVFDYSYLIQRRDHGFSGNPEEAGNDRTYSTDTLPQEYSSFGSGDYRESALDIRYDHGARTLGLRYEGYEIHMGRSEAQMPALAGNGNVYGSYVHGIFDAPGIADEILKAICARRGVAFSALGTFDRAAYRERQYDLLADAVRAGLDMEFVYRVLRKEI